MSQIDKLLTEAHLRGVKSFDFDVALDGIGIDIDHHRKMLKRYDVKEDKTLGVLLLKEQQLRDLSREWAKSVGLAEYSNFRVVILLEQEASE